MKVPTLKGTEASLSYAQCYLYLVSSSISFEVSVFHITWLDTFWTDRVCVCVCVCVCVWLARFICYNSLKKRKMYLRANV